MFEFCFFFWMIGEPVTTLHGDVSLPLVTLCFIILVGFFPEKRVWVLTNGWMQQ
jgi:hypothetical protein